MPGVKVLTVATAHPPHQVRLEELKSYIHSSLTPKSAARYCSILDKAHVRRRNTIAPIEELLTLRTIEDRARLFVRTARSLGQAVSQRALEMSSIRPGDVSTVISVSSTGYMAPSLDACLVEFLGLSNTVRRFSINQLGCSGAVSAIATAADLVAGSSRSALVVSVELCSLFLRSAEPSPIDLVSSILFGDGAAAAVVSAGPSDVGAEIVGSRSVLLENSLDRVGIEVTSSGLRLVLSRAMPAIIRRNLPRLVTDFLATHELRPEDLSFWFVHPGGPRVLDAVAHCFDLPRSILEASWSVWSDCGNMSSATALFVLERGLASLPPRNCPQQGLLLAFGPGVTCEMILLRTDAIDGLPTRRALHSCSAATSRRDEVSAV